VLVVTYSQFLSSQKGWGASWGTYKGIRMQTETEGHFGQMEVVRVYYSDNFGRSWKACDGWIMGYRGGYEKWVDSFVEATGVELSDGKILLMGRSLVGRIFKSISSDRGETFEYAQPTSLVTSDSPGTLKALPNGDLLFVWNQISREENRRGFRRCRLSSAISKDEGNTWSYFKNIYSIKTLSDRCYIPEEPVMTPVTGDDEVGELPEDFELWHYCDINVIGNEVFLSYINNTCDVEKIDEKDNYCEKKCISYKIKDIVTADTLILPIEWFY